MPDDESDEQWSGEATDPEDPTVAHDDIMKRLIDYQRSLRGDEEPAEFPDVVSGDETASEPEAVAPEPETAPPVGEEPVGQVVDVSVTEPASTPNPEVDTVHQLGAETEPTLDLQPVAAAEPTSATLEQLDATRTELESRVHRLEERLGRLGGKVAALRESFQEMAIAVDERLAAMKDEIDEVRSDTDEG